MAKTANFAIFVFGNSSLAEFVFKFETSYWIRICSKDLLKRTGIRNYAFIH